MDARMVGAGGSVARRSPHPSALVAQTCRPGLKKESFIEEIPLRVIK